MARSNRSEEEVELRSLRRDLEENFRPIFDKHEGEGVGVGDLRRELEEEGLLEHIPKRRMDELLTTADRDSDQQITYREFVNMMTYDLTAEERKPFRRVMRAAIADIVPRRMREDFLANYTCCPPPLFIPIITALEIAVFAYYVIDLETNHNIITDSTSGVAMYSPLVYKPSRRFEAWRFLSYMFMHQGYMHIIFNMIFQILFGLSLEIVHKWWRVGIVYVLGSVLGGLAHSVTDMNVGLVGASGGVYALLGAHCAAIIINWREMNYKCMDPDEIEDNVACGLSRILLSAPVRLLIILILVIPDTSLAVYRRITAPEGSKVGVSAHIAGFAGGMFLGIAVLKNVNQLSWERRLSFCTLIGFIIILIFCCSFNVIYDGYPEMNWCGWKDEVTSYKGIDCSHYTYT